MCLTYLDPSKLQRHTCLRNVDGGAMSRRQETGSKASVLAAKESPLYVATLTAQGSETSFLGSTGDHLRLGDGLGTRLSIHPEFLEMLTEGFNLRLLALEHTRV